MSILLVKIQTHVPVEGLDPSFAYFLMEIMSDQEKCQNCDFYSEAF